MTLAEASRLLAQEEINTLSSTERTQILVSDWWSLDTNSPEFLELPDAIQREIINEEAPRMPDDPVYDELLVKSVTFGYRGLRREYIARRLAEFGFLDVVITGYAERLFACPCCHYLTLSRRGEYDICPVCFWEDVGECTEDRYVSVNGLTLGEARLNFAEFGAYRQDAARHVDPHGSEKYYRAGEADE